MQDKHEAGVDPPMSTQIALSNVEKAGRLLKSLSEVRKIRQTRCFSFRIQDIGQGFFSQLRS